MDLIPGAGFISSGAPNREGLFPQGEQAFLFPRHESCRQNKNAPFPGRFAFELVER
jgi:hypothetical protein